MWLTNSSLKAADVPLHHLRSSRRLDAAVILATLFAIFMLDRATETAPVQHLYYLPIIYAAIVFDKRGGVSTAVVAIGLYHLASHAELGKPYSELDVVQIILFMAVAIVTAKLTRDARRLHILATTDDLTGLHNLRSFEAQLIRMVGSARTANTPLVMLALDVDHLKLINDAHGHLAGADAVRAVGELVASKLPANAVACRYGGDEFVIAIPCCTVSNAKRIGGVLCRAVYESAPVLANLQMPSATLSISVGIGELVTLGGQHVYRPTLPIRMPLNLCSGLRIEPSIQLRQAGGIEPSRRDRPALPTSRIDNAVSRVVTVPRAHSSLEVEGTPGEFYH